MEKGGKERSLEVKKASKIMQKVQSIRIKY